MTTHDIRTQHARYLMPTYAPELALVRGDGTRVWDAEGKEYLVGGQFTWADLAYLPFLHFHHLLEVDLPPNIAAWWELLAARDSARATVPAI